MSSLRESIGHFKKCWPQDEGVKQLGVEVLCLLSLYPWQCGDDKWREAQYRILPLFQQQFSTLEPQLARQCYLGIIKYINSVYFQAEGKLVTSSWLYGELRYTRYSAGFLTFRKNLESLMPKPKPQCIAYVSPIYSFLSNAISRASNLVLQNPGSAMIGLLFAQSAIVQAVSFKDMFNEFTGENYESIVEAFKELGELDFSFPIPILDEGDICRHGGVEKMIADKWQFDGKTVSFSQPCLNHFECYGDEELEQRPRYSRIKCDKLFKAAMGQECSSKLSGQARMQCREIADMYYGVVRSYGGMFYNEEQIPQSELECNIVPK